MGMSKANLPPHLVAHQGAIRCSVCKMPFPPDKPALRDMAFAEHARKAHRPVGPKGVSTIFLASIRLVGVPFRYVKCRMSRELAPERAVRFYA